MEICLDRRCHSVADKFFYAHSSRFSFIDNLLSTLLIEVEWDGNHCLFGEALPTLRIRFFQFLFSYGADSREVDLRANHSSFDYDLLRLRILIRRVHHDDGFDAFCVEDAFYNDK